MRLLSDVSPPRETVQFYTGLSPRSQQIHKTFSRKTDSGDSDGRPCSTDTDKPPSQLHYHPAPSFPESFRCTPASQRASGAPLLPRAHASWSEGEGPYHPRCRGCLQPPQAHTLSKFLQLPPGFFVSGKNQAAETTNLCPSPPRTPSRTPDASIGTFGCTCVTLSLSIHYRSARVTQAAEHSPVLWGLHMMFLHHSLQVD